MRLKRESYSAEKLASHLRSYISENYETNLQCSKETGLPLSTLRSAMHGSSGINDTTLVKLVHILGEDLNTYIEDKKLLEYLNPLLEAVRCNIRDYNKSTFENMLSITLKAQMNSKNISMESTIKKEEFKLLGDTLNLLEMISSKASMSKDEIVNLAIHNLKIYL